MPSWSLWTQDKARKCSGEPVLHEVTKMFHFYYEMSNMIRIMVMQTALLKFKVIESDFDMTTPRWVVTL